MKYIETVIVDDEKRSVELLETLLNDYCPQVKVIGKAYSVADGLKTIRALKPALLFLDIAMPDGDGFQITEELSEWDFEVVFTTAHNQFALRAFEFSALHYLLKPLDISQLKQTVERYSKRSQRFSSVKQTELLREGLNGRSARIALAQKQGFEFVEVDQIIRIEGEDNYSRFFLKDDKSLLVCRSIGEYEKLLEDNGFFRTHKKHLVNMSFIVSLQRGKTGFVVLESGEEIALSYRRRDAFIARLRDKVAF